MSNHTYNQKMNLILFNDKGEVVFSSPGRGIRPIFECIKFIKDFSEKYILYDKIVGLASAMLIVWSKKIISVESKVMSKKAKELLEKNNILVKSGVYIDKVMNQDGTDICPMEKLAIKKNDPFTFYNELSHIF